MTHRNILLCCQVPMLRLLAFALLFMAAFGGQNAFADLLSNDTKISASIGLEGEEDTYTFTAEAGDHIELRMVDTSDSLQLNPVFVLIGPTDGKVLATSGLESNNAVAVTYRTVTAGTYTVVAYGKSNTTGDYNLYFTRAPGANEHGLLTNDGVHTGTIDPGDVDSYTFTAEAGDHIELRMLDTSDSLQLNPVFVLIGPTDGKVLATSGLESNNAVAVTYRAVTAGTYTVVAYGKSNTTGDYNLYFTRAPGANEHGLLINDGVHAGTIDPGDVDSYTFTAEAGDHIELRMVDTSETLQLTPRFVLIGPTDGKVLATTAGSNVYNHGVGVTYTAAETGTYTIVAYGYLNTTGNYNLYFTRAPGANEHGLLTNDGVHAGTIDLGDLDSYTFTAEAGDHIELRMVDTSETLQLTPRFVLIGPTDGKVLATTAGSNVYNHGVGVTYTAAETGTYTIVAYGYLNTTGNYNLYFTRAPGANEHGLLTNDGVHAGTIDLGDLDSYTFTAEAGDHIELRMVDTSETLQLTPRFVLIGPMDGKVLATTAGSNVYNHGVGVTYTAAETGTYTIVAYGYLNTTGNYNLYFTRAPGANEHGPLINDGFREGTIDLGDVDTYIFAANTGDTIEVRMTDTSDSKQLNPRFDLIGPTDGTVLATGTESNNVAAITYIASKTGIYTVVAYGYLNTAGDYNFYLSGATGRVQGDLNGNGVDLADAILILKILVGIDSEIVYPFDVNDDDAIGLPEAIYILRVCAESQG